VTSERLGAVWPDVSARLVRLLASRGVDRALREDIVQEVAVRALAKQVPFDDAGDLYRWAATAARNLHVDSLRVGAKMTTDEGLVAVADRTDVAHAAERRVVLGQVFRAMAAMRPGERDAIIESLGADGHPHTTQALVRRHRARASLRRAVGGALVWVGAARLRLREVAESVRPAMQAVGAAVVLAPAVAVQMLSGAVPGATGAAPLPAVVPVTRPAPGGPAPGAAEARAGGSAGVARVRPALVPVPGQAHPVAPARPAPGDPKPTPVAGATLPTGHGGEVNETPNDDNELSVCAGIDATGEICTPSL
jgi:hypothetical protein